MPRVRDEHRGAHALRLAQHVAKQPLLRQQHDHGDGQRARMHGRDVFEMHEPVARAPQHPHADRNQDRAEKE